ncbi:MAG: GldG family protein [Spirochaetales bacterium]|nr:GldG family protein [Leptospiraceae bacterium]MCP5480229.1 GldG family protein [Spirochaetales bacterium]MCP5486372.1 GldG family protein [Spirochaetales bacterium]
MKLPAVFSSRAFLYGNVIALFFLANGAISRMNCQLDFSRDQRNSISDSTRQVLEKVREPVLIEAYISRDVPGQVVAMLAPHVSILRAMDRVGGDHIDLRIINPDSDQTRQQAEQRGIEGLNIDQARGVEFSSRVGYFGLFLQQGDRSAVINLYENGFIQDLEYRVLKEIKKMNRTSEISGLAFAAVPGSSSLAPPQRGQLPSKDGLYIFKRVIEEEKGEVEELALDRPVPERIRTIVLAGHPRLTELEEYHLDQFLLGGGNLLVMTNGFDFFMQPARNIPGMPGGGGSMGFASVSADENQSLNSWLGQYGILINGDVIFEPGLGLRINDPLGRTPYALPYPPWAPYTRQNGQIVSNHPALAGLSELVFPWFSTLDVRNATQTGVDFDVLVQTSAGAIRRTTGGLDFQEANEVGREPGEDYLVEPAPVAVLATGDFRSAFSAETLPVDSDGEPIDVGDFRPGQLSGRPGKLAVVSTPYLVSDLLIYGQANQFYYQINLAFLMNLLEAMEGDTDLLAARSRVQSVPRMLIEGEGWQVFWTWLHVLLLPLLAGIYGFVRLTGRHRRRGVQDVGGGDEVK